MSIKQVCRNCKFFCPKKLSARSFRTGVCTNPQSYYHELYRTGGDRAADRCFKPIEENKEVSASEKNNP